MATTPYPLVQESVTEGKRHSDSHHILTPNNFFKYNPYQYSPPEMARASISPTKSYHGYGETARPSPRPTDKKQVTFELLIPSTKSRARLPMRIMISKTDTTDSIITTVKNFYGLYDGKTGVSFQDRMGNIMIAAYDNFEDGMTIFVKTDDIPLITNNEVPTPVSASPKKPKLGPPFEMRPPIQQSRSGFQAGTRSPSPVSMKSAGHHKSRARSIKSHDDGAAFDSAADTFSDSDGGNGSVTSSRRSRADGPSAEISVDNILEGGRRKRAKFESSELPLFVPPQVPVTNSISSVSPQRRTHGDAASPLPFSNQRTFTYTQPLPSPHSHGRSDLSYMSSGLPAGFYGQNMQMNGHQLRGRPAVSYQPPRRSTGGILPTPEPTVGSVISDEDVAIQLMRLGDMSNVSHGRTSTSTIDDALSGKADAASSEEESEDDDEDIPLPAPRYPIKDLHSAGPKRKKPRYNQLPSDSVDSSGDEYNDGSFHGDSDDIIPGNDSDVPLHHHDHHHQHKDGSKPHPSLTQRDSVSSINGVTTKDVKPKSSKSKPKNPSDKDSSRKASVTAAIQQLGPDEEDLSSRPRCQRCRKSKKGCDRQRPCGRCKDAGIGIEGCLSEDEGNGRRGRYGRHMGVAVKKDNKDMPTPVLGPVEPGLSGGMSGGGIFLTPALPGEKAKKRKRST